jgi:hypothetical protein
MTPRAHLIGLFVVLLVLLAWYGVAVNGAAPAAGIVVTVLLLAWAIVVHNLPHVQGRR